MGEVKRRGTRRRVEAAAPAPGVTPATSYRHDVIVRFEAHSYDNVDLIAPWVGIVTPSPDGSEGAYVKPAALSFEEPDGYRRTYVMEPHVLEWLRGAIGVNRLAQVEIARVLASQMDGNDQYVVYDVARAFAEYLAGRFADFDATTFLQYVGPDPREKQAPENES